MRRALQEAEKAIAAGEVPVGAIAVFDGEVIAAGRNEVIARNDPTAHAEMLVLREAAGRIGNYRLKDVVVYVTLEPCPMCVSALMHARAGSLIYGANSDKWGYMSRFTMDLAVWNHNLVVYSGILENETGALLKEFFRSKRKH